MWCPEPDSNRHGTIRFRRILSPLRIPISPSGHGVASQALRAGEGGARAIIVERDDRRKWRRGSESNRRTRLCRPLHDHSATPPQHRWLAKSVTTPFAKNKNLGGPRFRGNPPVRTERSPVKNGAGNETRTRDPDLGKVVLYQLSYSRASPPSYDFRGACQPPGVVDAGLARASDCAISASFSSHKPLIQLWKRLRNASSFS